MSEFMDKRIGGIGYGRVIPLPTGDGAEIRGVDNHFGTNRKAPNRVGNTTGNVTPPR